MKIDDGVVEPLRSNGSTCLSSMYRNCAGCTDSHLYRSLLIIAETQQVQFVFSGRRQTRDSLQPEKNC